MTPKILIADDSSVTRDIFKNLLLKEGYEVLLASDGEEAIEMALTALPCLIICDLQMPKKSGIEVLQHIKTHLPDMIFIMLTAYGSIETAVEAIKKGAYDYLTKSSKEDEIIMAVKRAVETSRLTTEVHRLRHEVEDKSSFAAILGKSKVMQEVFTKIEKVAPYNTTVLILGETGTGKELVARAIHYNSPRKDKPFIPINCSAIPETLIESELFGHEKGAFTDAIMSKKGAFEEAERGSIFLDEIGEMSPNVQTKLLRVLQDGETQRIGEIKKRRVNTRVIIATNRDIKLAIKNGFIREDFYYRINVFPINIPPLRDRKEDIPLLAKHFLNKYTEETGRKIIEISPKVIDYFINYDWPGNVRELEHTIEYAVLLEETDVLTENSLLELHKSSKNNSLINKLKETYEYTVGNLSYNEIMERIERELLTSALKLCGGIKSKTAELLKLKRTTLIGILKRLGIED